MKLVTLTAAIALTAGTAFAQDTATDMNMDLPEPGVAFTQAVTIADQTGPGTLIALELDYLTDTAPVYVAEKEGDSSYTRLMIDGNSGDVLATESYTAKDAETLDRYMEMFSTPAEIAEGVLLASELGGELTLADLIDMDDLDDLDCDDIDMHDADADQHEH